MVQSKELGLGAYKKDFRGKRNFLFAQAKLIDQWKSGAKIK
jgi:hypothetical protein